MTDPLQLEGKMILVDRLFCYSRVSEEARRRGHANKRWCHMVSADLDELHVFAARLGLRREWFQDGRHPHYDLTEGKRKQAIRMGAQEATYHEVYWLWRGLNTEGDGDG